MALIIDNPIAWAHFRLRGGWRRTGIVSGAFFILAAIGALISSQADPRQTQQILYGWTLGMLAFNAAVMILYIPGRIAAAVRQDMTTRMIESHRLMPLPASHAVAGYIAGSVLQPLILCAAMFFLGSICASAAQVSFDRWLSSNLVLLIFAIFAWVMVTFASFQTKAVGAIVFLPMAFPVMGDGSALSLVPALTVLLSPIMGHTIFDMRSIVASLPMTLAIAFAAQAFFAVVCFVAAARKYRDPVTIGLPPLLGLALLAGWLAITTIALRQWDDFKPRGWGRKDFDIQTQVVASMAVTMILSLSPISAAAWLRRRWRQHELIKDPAPMRRPIPVPLVLAAAVIVPLVIPLAPPSLPVPSLDLLIRSAIVIAAFVVGMYCLFYWVYLTGQSAANTAMVWVLLTWAGPVVTDLIRYGLTTFGETQPLDGIASCSPIGALLVMWSQQGVDTTPGIVMQVLIMMLPVTLCLFAVLPRRYNARVSP